MANKNRPPMWSWIDDGHISEGLKAGSVVGRLYAHDPDGDKIRYQLTDDANGAFKIVGDKLVTTRVLDYEFQTEYRIDILVRDEHGAWYEASSLPLLIQVDDREDANDFGERIDGDFGDTSVIGTKRSEVIWDNFRNAFVDGKGGHDEFYMAAGNDHYRGGAGADEFYFSGYSQRDVIEDFKAQGFYHDTIHLSALFDGGWQQFMDKRVREDGRDVVINLGWSDYYQTSSTLRIEGIDKDDLNRDNLVL